MGTSERLTRRAFLIASGAGAGWLALGGTDLRAVEQDTARTRPGGAVPPGEWWASGGPRVAPSTVEVVDPDEPGERLVVSGTVYADNGITPMPGVTVYVYQTDVEGLYNREARLGAPHRIRGWMNTDERGHYEFRTIKPGHYPNRTQPAHIHMTVCRHDLPEWWLPEIRFRGDPLLTAADYDAATRDGRFASLRPIAQRAGGLYCTRDIRL